MASSQPRPAAVDVAALLSAVRPGSLSGGSGVGGGSGSNRPSSSAAVTGGSGSTAIGAASGPGATAAAAVVGSSSSSSSRAPPPTVARAARLQIREAFVSRGGGSAGSAAAGHGDASGEGERRKGAGGTKGSGGTTRPRSGSLCSLDQSGERRDGGGEGGGGGSMGSSAETVVLPVYAIDDEGRVTVTRVRPVEDDADGCGGYEEVLSESDKDDEDGDAMDIDGGSGDHKSGKISPKDDLKEHQGGGTTHYQTPKKRSGQPTEAEADDAVPDVISASSGTDSGEEENVPGSDPITALQDQLPLESLPGRPTISFRRAEADGRLASLLQARSRAAEDMVQGLARSTAEYGRLYPDHRVAASSNSAGINDGGKGAAVAGTAKGEANALTSPSSVVSDEMASLLQKDGSTDRSELRRRLRLEKARLAMERPGSRAYLPPSLHEVVLGDWESQIDWEGVKKGGDQRGNNAKSARPNANVNAMPPTAILSTPYNCDLDAMDFSSSVSWLGADAPAGHNSALARSVPLLLERTVAGRSVALPAAAAPVRPLPFGATNVFESREERELSTLATSTATSLGSSFRPDGEKLEALIKAKQNRRKKLATKKSHRIMEAMGTLGLGSVGRGRTITSSLMGPGGTERTGRVSRGVGGSSAHDAEYVEQLDFVYNHQLVRPDFSLVQLRQYHRPRLPRSLVRSERPWQFQIKIQATDLGKLSGRVAAADGSTVLGSYQSVMGGGSGSTNRSIVRPEDLTPSEGDLAIVEYCEERPLMQLLKGHTVRIVNYYRGDKARCPVSAGGGDRPARKRHHGDKALEDDRLDAGAIQIEKPPRLKGPNQTSKGGLPSAADLIGVGKKKKKKDGSTSTSSALVATPTDNIERSKEAKKITILPDGATEILPPKVHGPFIGEVEEGMTQTGLISNLFAAPMFRHESEPSDFLMVLMKNRKHEGGEGEAPRALGVCLRPFPANVYTVGQVEPRVKVFQPNTNQEKTFTNPFIAYQIAKALDLYEHQNDGEGLSLDEIGALFESNPIPATALRMRIKSVANYDRESGHYTTHPVGFEDFPGVEALARRFTPEGVAAYESSCAASRRLADLGLQVLHTGATSMPNVASAMVYLTSRLNAARERKSKMAKNLHFAKTSKSKTKANQIVLYEKAAKKLEDEWKEIKRRHEIAKFIFEELQLAPWHLSSEFIDVHKNGQGTAMMKLTGLGDPSGRGEAYSFLREADSKPNKGTANSDGALNAQIKKITGTENDLRKLTMKQMASLLRSYGMGQKEIDTLKRWDRVHVIRDLSTKAASDGMADGLERYARGEKMKLRDQKKMYQDRIQEIWRRERVALSTDAGGSLDVARGSAEAAEVTDVEGGREAPTGTDKNNDEEMKGSDSDSEDDEELAAAFEEDLMDVKQTSELVAAQIRGSTDDSAFRAMGGQRKEDRQTLDKDARELAAFQRQQEEERAAQGLIGKAAKDGEGGVGHQRPVSRPDRKVIRRRVTKTLPDGTQTTTFRFIVMPSEVEKILETKKAKEEKKRSEKKKRRSRTKQHEIARFDDDGSDNIVGHSIFEDDDEEDHRSSIKIEVHRRTVTRKKKGGGTSPSRGMGRPSKVSLESSKSLGKAGGDKRKKKRKRDLEEEDVYATAYKRMGTSNRKERGAARERMPHVIFADRLESLRLAVERRPGSGPFHRPVDRRAIPAYYETISTPIDLQEIGNRNQKYQYKSADAFVADFELMKNNAIKFNGAGSVIANEAVAIYEYVKKEVADNRAEFDAMEEAVEDQMSGSRKRKKNKSDKSKTSKTKALAKAAPNNDSGGTAKKAEVVLDGIKTTVDIGDMDFNFSDSDDSVTGN